MKLDCVSYPCELVEINGSCNPKCPYQQKQRMRTEGEIKDIQEEILRRWEKIYGKSNIISWVACTYSVHMLDYVLGKLSKPPIIELLNNLENQKCLE